MSDEKLDALVARAASGDSGALRSLRDEIEPSLAKIVEDVHFVGRVGQREDDRSNIVFEVIGLLEARAGAGAPAVR